MAGDNRTLAEAAAALLARLGVAERMGWHAVTVEVGYLKTLLAVAAERVEDEQHRLE